LEVFYVAFIDSYSQISSIIAILAAIFFGACAGSFINATAMRTVAGRKWWGMERSVCDNCGAPLKTADLIPIFSFIFLRGRCRQCHAPIAKRHFAVELLSAVLTGALFARWNISPALAVSLCVLWFSLFNSLTDIESGYIYDIWALALGAAGLLFRLFSGTQAVVEGLLGGALGFGTIAAIIILSRGGMGWGDAMLMLGIGAAVGWKYCALSLYSGFMVGGVIVVPLLIIKKLKRKDAIPLGPFLAAGSIIVLFAGDVFLRRLSAIFGSGAGWPWG
jgi:leader peptidase (prepilin peptidase)/N-methyltransferase